MPIILAIEPDRRQAAQLAGVVRQRVGAELILADTTERALDAMGNRVPDMVLVPAFLSPQDDAALAAALRVIAAAAHVRTLTIPLLANGEPQEAAGGILARWRRGRAESPAPDGCDPAVFAEQITAYLKEAAAERAELEVAPDEAAGIGTPEFLDVPAVELATPDLLDIPTVELATTELLDVPTVELATPEWIEPPATLEWIEPPVVESIERPEAEPLIDLSPELAALWESTVEEPERPEAWLIPETVTEEPLVVEALVEEFLTEEPEPPGAPVEPWIPVMLTPAVRWPALEGVDAEPPPSLDEFVDEPEPRPEPRLEPIAAAASARSSPEWTELVASLRQDIERRRGEPATKQQWQAKKPQSVQDEWGFFDPAQCGFSALLAKLEEITEPDDAATGHRSANTLYTHGRPQRYVSDSAGRRPLQ